MKEILRANLGEITQEDGTTGFIQLAMGHQL